MVMFTFVPIYGDMFFSYRGWFILIIVNISIIVWCDDEVKIDGHYKARNTSQGGKVVLYFFLAKSEGCDINFVKIMYIFHLERCSLFWTYYPLRMVHSGEK